MYWPVQILTLSLLCEGYIPAGIGFPRVRHDPHSPNKYHFIGEDQVFKPLKQFGNQQVIIYFFSETSHVKKKEIPNSEALKDTTH